MSGDQDLAKIRESFWRPAVMEFLRRREERLALLIFGRKS